MTQVAGTSRKRTRKMKEKDVDRGRSYQSDEEGMTEPDTSSEKISPLYLSFSYESYQQRWFAINPSSSFKPKAPLSPIAELDVAYPDKDNMASVVIGSKIYVFGGYCKQETTGYETDLGRRNAFVYDTDAPCKKWVPLSDMLAPRAAPKVVTCGSMIYVFGCNRTPASLLQPWAEAYDYSGTKQWRPIKNKPLDECSNQYLFEYDDDDIVDVYSCVAVPERETIVVCLADCGLIVLFDIKQWNWLPVDVDIPICPPHLNGIAPAMPYMVAVEHMLYMFYHLDLYFYDFCHGEKGLQPVHNCLSSIVIPGDDRCMVHPFHLGKGNFCFLFSPRGREEESAPIHCLKFGIERLHLFGGNDFMTTIHGHDVIEVDHHDIFYSCEPVQRN